jgi:rare lipoprotein A (peptidoglycan hydrolase)
MNHKLTARLLAGATISSLALFTSSLGQPVHGSEENDSLTLTANASIITKVNVDGGEISQNVKSNSERLLALTFTSSNPSFYSQGDDGGTMTASGKRFNHNAMTAAHRTLPFGTKVRVTNLRNGRSVIVTINDRGPFTGGRIIDLSRGAAQKIGMIKSGVARVRVDVLGR